MSTVTEKGSWIQCTECGKIYYIDREVPIDKMYITCVCPRCDHTRGLNLGDDVTDKYLYADVNIDERYYQY